MVCNEILVLGSIAYDYIMQFPGNFIDNLSVDSHLNKFQFAIVPNSKSINWGGTAGNISYNIAQLNSEATVITSVGKDFEDLGYNDHLRKYPSLHLKIDLLKNNFTASCYIVNDISQNQTIIFHPGAMDHSVDISLKEKGISKNNIKLASISPENTKAMLQWAEELIELDIPFIFDPGQMTPYFETLSLEKAIRNAYLLIGNEHEIKMICDKFKVDLQGLLNFNSRIIITRGIEGCEIFQKSESLQIPAYSSSNIVDTTGAGDGFRAGLLVGLVNDLPLKDACRLGTIIASFIIETEGPQNQHFSLNDLKQRYFDSFGQSLPPIISF
ncbi:MAG: carbohydrate kinase family protein [Promethearchaeota archaeon]